MGKNRENIREKNLIPFKKGESGNPNGRPKGQRDYATIYREALIKLAESNGKSPDDWENEILSKALVSARSGDYRFYKDILDRLHGTPVSRTEIYGKDGKELPIPIINLNVLPNNSDSKDSATQEED